MSKSPWTAPARWAGLIGGAALAAVGLVAACDDDDGDGPVGPSPLDPGLVAEGQRIFRFDTFGDETFWTDTLRMHEVIQGGVSPAAALSVGLKVDGDTLPQAVRNALAAGQIDLNDPATTVTLLDLGAVVGVVTTRPSRPPSRGRSTRPSPGPPRRSPTTRARRRR